MAIYSTFSTSLEAKFATTARTNAKGKSWTQVNDMWTAFHRNGPDYGAAATKFWSGVQPRVFRKTNPR